MALPVYGDLGKSARDVFGKGFHFGLFKLEAKTTTASGVGFTAGLTHNNSKASVLANLETKYKNKEYGLTITEKWNTDNTLSSDFTIEDKLCKGLKLTLDSSIGLDTDKRSAVLKSTYKHNMCSINTNVDIFPNGPVVNAAAVVGHSGWLAGYQLTFDTKSSKLQRNNFALGYAGGDFNVHTNVNDGKSFGASVHRRVTKDLEGAVELGWTAGANSTKFALGAKYNMDCQNIMRAKINNNSEIGLGFQHKIRKGVTLTLSSLIDAKNLNQGGHKIGMCLELDA